MADRSVMDFEASPFFEMTPDLVCIAGKDGFFRKVNRSVIDTLEYSEEELFSKPIFSFMHPKDRDMTGREREKLLNGKPLINFQNRYVSKSGKIIWLHWTSIYFPEKEVVFAIAKNITERKQIEKEIEEKYAKFKNLTDHYKRSLEKDRKYLAIELHEELAQLATTIKVDLDSVSDNMSDLADRARKRIDHAMAASELLINAIRRLTFSVSPDILDDFGLNETLRWLCREFENLNGIPCRFESLYDEDDLSASVKLDLFRICQEALRNIMRHAQADSVKISINDMHDSIRLAVVDDGKGFDLKQKKAGNGIIWMRERAAAINSLLAVKTRIGKGTSVAIEIAKQQADP